MSDEKTQVGRESDDPQKAAEEAAKHGTGGTRGTTPEGDDSSATGSGASGGGESATGGGEGGGQTGPGTGGENAGAGGSGGAQ